MRMLRSNLIRWCGCLTLLVLLIAPGCTMEWGNVHRLGAVRKEAVAKQTDHKPACTQVGKASWYGPGFDGKITASGEIYRQHGRTAAHRTLPLGTLVQVTHLQTGKSVEVQINDRGPYVPNRVIDLSHDAAKKIGMTEKGVAMVKIEADSARKPSGASLVACAETNRPGKSKRS